MLCNRCDDPTCRRLDAAQASYDRHCLYMDASHGALFIAACDVAPDARTPEQAAEFARVQELRREWQAAHAEFRQAETECLSRPAVDWRQVALDGRAEIARVTSERDVYKEHLELNDRQRVVLTGYIKELRAAFKQTRTTIARVREDAEAWKQSESLDGDYSMALGDCGTRILSILAASEVPSISAAALGEATNG